MPRVDEHERAKAVELISELVKHQMNRVRDCLDRAEVGLDPSSLTSTEAVIDEINRAANIAGRVQQASQMWKGIVTDWQKNNPNSTGGA